MSRAVLIAGGSIDDYEFISSFISESDFIACADRGIVHCNNMGLKADLWIGDFDSCNFDEYKNSDAAKDAQIITLPEEKDKTDTEYVLNFIAETKKFDNILLVGGIGTRIDHTLMNIHLIEKMSEQQIFMEILNEKNRIRISNDSGIYFRKSEFKYISIIPISSVVNGVTLSGNFKYPLKDATLFRYDSLSVSNELLEGGGTVHIADGSALIIESRD